MGKLLRIVEPLGLDLEDRDLVDQLTFLVSGEDLGLLAVLHVLDLLLEFLDPPVFQGSVLFFECFNLFEQDIGLVIKLIALRF